MEKKRIAIHEASHAVAAMLFNNGLEYVTINSSNPHVQPYQGSEDSFMLFAGPCAEVLFSVEPNDDDFLFEAVDFEDEAIDFEQSEEDSKWFQFAKLLLATFGEDLGIRLVNSFNRQSAHPIGDTIQILNLNVPTEAELIEWMNRLNQLIPHIETVANYLMTQSETLNENELAQILGW